MKCDMIYIMKSKTRSTRHSATSPRRISSDSPARERRAEARASLARAREREELFGEAFDFLSARDCLRVLVCVGGMEAYAAGAAGWMLDPRPWCKPMSAFTLAVGAGIIALAQTGVAMSLWAVARFLFCFRRTARRPIYYPQERRRRERLAAERRKVRERFTASPRPTPRELLAQYARARESEREALRFGSLMCDLEAHCDNSLVRDADGEIRGRNPGVRGWLREHCPAVAAHYSRAMHYKALAEKFRQAAGAEDPVPAAWLADGSGEAVRALLGGRARRELTVRITKANGDRKGRRVSRAFSVDGDTLGAAWRKAGEIIAEAEAETRRGTNSAKAADAREGGRDVVARTRRGTARGEEAGAKEARAGDEARTRCGTISRRGCVTRRGCVARLEEALDERLAPEFAPSGWRMSETAPPRTSLA